MFIGEYEVSMDAKGRVPIPAKFRLNLKSAVITRGLDKSLFVYPKAEWEKIAQKLAALPISDSNSRAFVRLMLAGAFDLEFDKQGRVLIPEYLRQFAALSKKVVVAGLYNRLEVWDQETWENYKEVTEKESTSIAEALGELGV
ncbi:MAG: cell division/cell wall cluster transcriptional repressor MraZ [Candidatus Doudnabacteria bacterium RIFCSPLOWO2_02_FULL_48_8]|uniref:Transcriptional regulator MraZ n=1 Tax=Candidatus Doudnabacteria bacterium RIFCSPHIGHO2_01_FULL_46_24 TaxID=1817825 RepID=A0A1F5NU88_9BACT|nr:MAG: cell division/cell wall cluster transcriptional repressor MraZ [Candidatus Doudnabacteria bacterium RIFCSPHIGHO2_01_FULL_46_24]OGE95177.1 MAG: cell division/cell wall cluster transcriptional repressor MraZ [Candidatus Doudnabacteria bacterium RIFCSPLOWO2_02_FULL_48_8]OGE95704.1 MAG: cell division/cell wall cluster transcriptional repressor MraZ [Candidatus Doudnabacteria bacterium RIFCSPHIGHO2_12_FULL_48_11]